ncbi:MAG TPA: ATP-binding protein [candidate division Zixibacteria bacterium]|nr:ATP-binding protein [candidate division Zixibacteria bacterium]
MAQSSDFTIPGRLGNISDACAFVVSGAEQAGFSVDELFRIELACDEACTNIIEHAYGGDDVGVIRISWRIDDKTFTIIMNDDGPPFDPDEVPPPEIPADPDNLDGLKTGGLGIYFMRNLMDEVRFSRDEQKGNTLVMVKHRPSNEHK